MKGVSSATLALLLALCASAQAEQVVIFPSSAGTAAPGQVPGTSTSDNANTGNVGQYAESVITVGSAVSLTTNTAKTVTSFSLTAGDWNVQGCVFFTGNAATLVQYANMSINLSADTQSSDIRNVGQTSYGATGVALFAVTDEVVCTGYVRVPLSSTTTVYLIAFSGFTTNSESAYGFIRARRAR